MPLPYGLGVSIFWLLKILNYCKLIIITMFNYQTVLLVVQTTVHVLILMLFISTNIAPYPTILQIIAIGLWLDMTKYTKNCIE